MAKKAASPSVRSEQDALVPRNEAGLFTYLVTHFDGSGRIATMSLQLAPDIQAARREVEQASPLHRTKVERASHRMVATVERLTKERDERLRRMTF